MIPIVATLLLVILVVFLFVFHQYNLSKVGVIVKANPLISTEGEKLISQDQSTRPAIDAGSDDVKVNPDVTVSDTSSTSTDTSGGSATGGQSSSTPSSTPSQPGTQPNTPFGVTIDSITSTAAKSCVVVLCTSDYTFTGTVTANNGPGVVQYRWERSDGTIGSTEQKTVGAGTSTFTTSYTWQKAKTGWVKLRILAPNQTEKQYTIGS